MDKIRVYETDRTLRTTKYDVTENVVYIPGLTETIKTDNNKSLFNNPTICRTVKDFEKLFGENPYQFKENQTNFTNITKNSYDVSYIYAKELLNYGLTICYEAIDIEGINNALVVDEIYKRLPNSLELILDKNNYNIKFITTGGYQSFDCEIPAAYELTKDTEIVPDKNYYTRTGSEDNYTYTEVSNPQLSDIGNYYEGVLSLTELLLQTAAQRGDCLALIDYDRNKDDYTNVLKI